MRMGMLGFGAAAMVVIASAEPARITAFAKAQGWRLLFDGESFAGWHSFGSDRVTANWTVREHAICAVGEGRALVSDAVVGDFELSLAWRVEAGGRAEVFFRLAEDRDLPAHTGLVFQLAGPDVECGGTGGVVAPLERFEPVPGRWHEARLVVWGRQVEHWIDGRLLLSYRIGDGPWKTGLASSRYAEFRDYGQLQRGGLALGGREAMFRNLKLRPL